MYLSSNSKAGLEDIRCEKNAYSFDIGKERGIV